MKREKKAYGYARVSTKDQNEDRQMIALLEYGIHPKNIYMDKQSGKDFDWAVERYRQKQISLNQALEMSGISRSCFYQRLKEADGQNTGTAV